MYACPLCSSLTVDGFIRDHVRAVHKRTDEQIDQLFERMESVIVNDVTHWAPRSNKATLI